MLPADSHVHSEWSWDADDGAMAATCARAVELGLPALTFTDHADFTPGLWTTYRRLGSPWSPSRC
ncbi:PHP domain-containing protein [Kribbella sandramycini]|uniref:Histidinol phosphatase-like PHP family hydrolase n=1 Tax=Kribbella sandramycini TaxID=60450 RepID=A0A841STG5_9ACTN|nr:PHP domain-containing protein [Kribbella sandramycini]MBB6571306.1 histidinol phosphatase-like PHP family hydrolase [Kribbella sandramycini]